MICAKNYLIDSVYKVPSMKIENLTDEEKYKCFIEFKTRCYYVYRTYQINKVLFEENEDVYNNLESPKFINNALIDHFLLQLHLITDPVNFGKSEDKNLSVFFFLEWAWKIDVKDKLSELAQKLKYFVNFERDKNPRHKLLAHWDVATILNVTVPLGAFHIGEEINFFKNLNEFIQVMGNAMGYQEDWDIFTDKKADETKFLNIIKSGMM
jgi:hypothetical protein